MAPAEIWQGGKIVNVIQGNNMHVGRLDGAQIEVEDADPGCKISRLDGEKIPGMSYLGSGVSVTLDGGEIVKSVKAKE